ncbi:MAG: tetratricopeptide repeat protein, partial [Xanthomonadales bacterium]|nr:tetratricopeptide repeat protein [Xanthomonadales bacterium]
VSALKVALLDEDETQLRERYQPSLEAYEQLILGRQEVEKRTAEALATAEAHFKKAIELDPNYSLAYVGLADTYALQRSYSDLTLEQSLELRAPPIEKAIELDPLSGEAYTSKANLLMERGELERSEEAFERAVELNPSYARAYHWYSILLNDLGRYEEALETARKASELDPLSPIIGRNLAGALWDLGRVEEAEFVTMEGIRKNPDFHNNYGFMAAMQFSLGRIGRAKRWQEEAYRLNPNVGAHAWGCRLLLELAADEELEACIASLEADYPDHPNTTEQRSRFNSAQGKREANLARLTQLRERYSENDVLAQLYDYIRAFHHAQLGDIDRARMVMESAYPQFFSNPKPAVVDNTNWDAAIWAAWIAQQQGEDELSEVLLQGAEKVIATRHRTRGLGYGVADVVILTMRGEEEAALAKLREAIDEGWRYGWRYTFQPDVRLRPLADDPAFMAMAREVEADIAAQREWYFENRDTPIAQL